MKSGRGQNKAPGEFRKIQVFIGMPGADISEATYVPPTANEVVPLFSNLEKYLNSNEEKDSLVQIAIAHYQLDAIFVRPIFSTTSLHKHVRIKNAQTLYTLIGKFIDLGILKEVDSKQKRNKNDQRKCPCGTNFLIEYTKFLPLKTTIKNLHRTTTHIWFQKFAFKN